VLHNLCFLFHKMPLFHNFIFFCSSNIFFLNHALKHKYQHGPLKVNGVSLTLHAFEVFRIVSSNSLDDRVLEGLLSLMFMSLFQKSAPRLISQLPLEMYKKQCCQFVHAIKMLMKQCLEWVCIYNYSKIS